AGKIEASVGDTITLVAPSGRSEYRVADIVENKGLAGGTEDVRSAALVPISTLQRVLDRESQYNMIEVSVVGGRRVDEQLSEDLAEELQLAFINDTAAEALFEAFKAPVVVEALRSELEDRGSSTGGPFSTNTFADLVAELENDSPSDEFKVAATNIITLAIVGGVIEGIGDARLAQSLLVPMSQLVELQVDPIKNRGLEIAEFIGSFFTLIFSIFGSFSIIVGLLLIFLVFVMLAAARTTEMGIIRAVGTRRRHLVQMFVYEGIVYSIGAAALGTALGLVASVLLVQILSTVAAQEETFSFSYGVTLQSIVIAFCAGLFITALTVAFSAYRVSKLNIVVAIRGLGQEFVSDEVPWTGKRAMTVVYWLGGPLTYAYSTYRQWRAGHGILGRVAVFFLLLLIVPWIAVLVRQIFKFFQPWLVSGWPLVPLGVVLALSGLHPDKQVLGWAQGSAALWTMGVTLVIIGSGLIIRRLLDRRGSREEFQKRVSMSFIGVVMLVFWGLPFDALERYTGELNGGPEMFLLSGVSLVAAAVWVVMYNADIVVWVVTHM
ncbi:MAG: ABC transporter permease, partial [Pseudomonadales bacterium]